jgi:hypothetical protein
MITKYVVTSTLLTESLPGDEKFGWHFIRKWLIARSLGRNFCEWNARNNVLENVFMWEHSLFQFLIFGALIQFPLYIWSFSKLFATKKKNGVTKKDAAVFKDLILQVGSWNVSYIFFPFCEEL